jgi:cell division protein FtsW
MNIAVADRSPSPALPTGVRDLRPLASLLVSLTLILMVVGFAMLGSASSSISRRLHGDDPLALVKKQLCFAALAVVGMVVCARVDYRRWRALCVPIGLVTLIALCVVLTTEEINGSRRWISLKFFQLQPSELAKISLITLVAAHISYNARRMGEIVRGLLIPMAVVGLFCGMVLLEPDYGTTLLLAVVGMLMLFLGGVRIGPLCVVAVSGAVGFVLMVLQDPVRTRRIIAFLNPERYSDQEAFQQLAARTAFILGGPTGAGFSQSIQKLNYLPEAHSDFIYAIMGEELGLSATLAVPAFFLIIFFLGLRIAAGAADTFGRMLAYGITLLLTFQALINMAVVTGLMPNKGLPLPFISYGGSSLVVSAAMVGMLVSIARVSSDESIQLEKNPVKDRLQWL